MARRGPGPGRAAGAGSAGPVVVVRTAAGGQRAERDRTQSVNTAFTSAAHAHPLTEPVDRKLLFKIETLRLASSYIAIWPTPLLADAADDGSRA